MNIFAEIGLSYLILLAIRGYDTIKIFPSSGLVVGGFVCFVLFSLSIKFPVDILLLQNTHGSKSNHN